MEGFHHSHHLTKVTHGSDEAKPFSIEADKRRGEHEDKPRRVLQPQRQGTREEVWAHPWYHGTQETPSCPCCGEPHLSPPLPCCHRHQGGCWMMK